MLPTPNFSGIPGTRSLPPSSPAPARSQPEAGHAPRTWKPSGPAGPGTRRSPSRSSARSLPADFADGIRLAANHSGDSDSTAAITGNLLGTLLGEAAIGPEWLDGLELRDEIAQVADDLDAALDGTLTGEAAAGAVSGLVGFQKSTASCAVPSAFRAAAGDAPGLAPAQARDTAARRRLRRGYRA